MEHFFELPVAYKDEQLLLNGRLVTFAYEYKFYIQVKGQELIFERDDALQFRVIAAPGEHPQIDKELVTAILNALDALKSDIQVKH